MNLIHTLAHAFGERVELPIPVVAFVLGGAAVVAFSFVVVLPTKVERSNETIDDTTDVRRVSGLAGAIGLVLLAALCWAGLAGTQELPENILPTVFWVYVWVVLPLLVGILGDFTSGVNPYGYLAQLGEQLRPLEACLAALAGLVARGRAARARHAGRTRLQPDDDAAADHRLDADRLRGVLRAVRCAVRRDGVPRAR